MTDPFNISSAAPLLIAKSDNSWTLTLNRPDKRNALSGALVEALLTALTEAEEQNVALIILRGKGKNFSSGFDFSNLETISAGDLLLRFVRIETLLQRLAHSTCSTLVLAHGTNFGAGVDIIASCKHRIADPNACFRMPGLKFGLVLGTGRLSNLVGFENARHLLENTKTFNAQEAIDIGFLNQVVTQNNWHLVIQQTQETALSLAPKSRNHLYTLTIPDQRARDMAVLVESASEPGLKERIQQYINS